MGKSGSLGMLIILTTIYAPHEASLLSFFSGDQDEEITVPKLILAPANATISPNVSVTLGCKANVAASQCQWVFYSTTEPEKRKHLTPFSPTSPNERKKQSGSRAENDCSLTIHKIAAKYDGKWICSILPVSGGQKFLISKPAFLHIYERPQTPKSQGEIFADESEDIGQESEETTKNPREPVKLPYFVIKRNPDQSSVVTWNLKNIQQDVHHCSWISPNRVRISSQNSLSDLVWTSQSNNSCGIHIESQETSLDIGEWTAVAESEDNKPIISAKFYLSPAPKYESSTMIAPTTAQYYKDTMGSSDSVQQYQNAQPYFILLLGVIGLLSFVVLVLICCVCHFCKNPTHKYSNEVPKSPPSPNSSIVGISQRAPIRALKSNPQYESSDPNMTNRNLPETPKSILASKNSDSKRHSVIGIDSDVVKEPSGHQHVAYSHIIPKYEGNNNHEYLTIKVPNAGTLTKRPSTEETQYEQVNKPLPSYENQTDFTTFGFASLRRPSKPRVAIRKVSSMSITSGQSQGGASDSGVDSDQMEK